MLRWLFGRSPAACAVAAAAPPDQSTRASTPPSRRASDQRDAPVTRANAAPASASSTVSSSTSSTASSSSRSSSRAPASTAALRRLMAAALMLLPTERAPSAQAIARRSLLLLHGLFVDASDSGMLDAYRGEATFASELRRRRRPAQPTQAHPSPAHRPAHPPTPSHAAPPRSTAPPDDEGSSLVSSPGVPAMVATDDEGAIILPPAFADADASAADPPALSCPVSGGRSLAERAAGDVHAGDTTVRYTVFDVAEHSSEDDCWLIIDNRVYDVTQFVEEHPGGAIIAQSAGDDATSLFEDVGHSDEAYKMLQQYYIGDLVSQ